jgi:hypothetical protein
MVPEQGFWKKCQNKEGKFVPIEAYWVSGGTFPLICHLGTVWW